MTPALPLRRDNSLLTMARERENFVFVLKEKHLSELDNGRDRRRRNFSQLFSV